MAVPFNMPEDQDEVEVIINQLQTLLTKLQAALRRSNSDINTSGSASGTSQQTQSGNPRVRSSSSLRSRARNEETPVNNPSTTIPSANLPDLLSNLAWLASASQETGRVNSQLVVAQRRRSDSESSCGDNTKISGSEEQLPEWNQVGVDPNKITDGCPKEETDGPEIPPTKSVLTDVILSKFVPGPISAPLWTAMICVVGWHLFRAR